MRKLLLVVAAILIAFWIVGVVFRTIISPMVHLLFLAVLAIIAVRLVVSKFHRKV